MAPECRHCRTRPSSSPSCCRHCEHNKKTTLLWPCLVSFSRVSRTYLRWVASQEAQPNCPGSFLVRRRWVWWTMQLLICNNPLLKTCFMLRLLWLMRHNDQGVALVAACPASYHVCCCNVHSLRRINKTTRRAHDSCAYLQMSPVLVYEHHS